MLFFILIVAAIVLIDLSGMNLTERITPLIYILPEETQAENSVDLGEGLSTEELAARAEEHIFAKGGDNEKTK